jgi:hypothetical protein
MMFSGFKRALLPALLCACSAPEKYNAETQRFGSYLESAFGLELPEQHTYFFIVPASGCPACQKNALQSLGEDRVPNSAIYIITPEREGRPVHFPADHFLVDENPRLNKLGLGFGGTGMLEVLDRKIISACALTPGNTDSVIAAMH